MNILEIIENRRSWRTYNSEKLTTDQKRELTDFINQNKIGLMNEVVDFNIIEKTKEEKKMRLEYGIIRGHHTYILGTSLKNIDSRVNYGYLLEKVVLKATEMKLATCWVGYFDKDYFNEINLNPEKDIPSIAIVGFSPEEHSFSDKFARFVVSANKRKDWGKLFFDYQSLEPLNKDTIKNYADSLEMLRLAPSSGNTQPWRIYYDTKLQEFHFFKKKINRFYEARGLHDIDMGIAAAHFELASRFHALNGNWGKKTLQYIPEDLTYIVTWQCHD